MRYWLISFIIGCIIYAKPASAQNNQFTIVSDNDGYLSLNNDGYYTNGVKLAYQWRRFNPQQKKTVRVHEFELGHEIYTSQFSGEFYEAKLDRPLTGHLYAAFHNTLYSEKQHMLKWGLSAGFIGPPAQGEEVQKRAHKIMQINTPTYWDRQLNAATGINADFAWSPELSQKATTSRWAFKPLFSATAGTFFTNAGAGGALVFGRFNRNNASAFWNNHHGTKKEEREFFGYLFPMFYYKAYDATVQGGMFNTAPEKIHGELNPAFFQARLGLTYAGNRMTVGGIAIFESKQSLTQFSPQYYARLKVGWMW